MSRNLEMPPAESETPSLREQLATLENNYASRRADLLQAIAKENEEARALAQNDIFLEKDPVAKNAVRSGKTGEGEEIPSLLAFLKERRQVLANNPGLGAGGRRRPEDIPRDARADDPDIWKRGTGK